MISTHGEARISRWPKIYPTFKTTTTFRNKTPLTLTTFCTHGAQNFGTMLIINFSWIFITNFSEFLTLLFNIFLAFYLWLMGRPHVVHQKNHLCVMDWWWAEFNNLFFITLPYLMCLISLILHFISWWFRVQVSPVTERERQATRRGGGVILGKGGL